jgi:ParB family chromosome partitioning protein
MAAKRRTTAEMLEAATNTGAAIQAQDRAVEARAEVAQSTMPLGKILERTSDTRELREQHVTDLAESITVLGLLEPLVVDIRGKMLAGGHRKAAIQLLKERDPSVYKKLFPNDQVPVRVMGFDAEVEPDQALQVEVAENEKRRDYTVSEARALAERLRSAGYVDVKGRPAEGEKALRPALEVIMGKSLRTVRRYLNEEEVESRTDVTLSAQAEKQAAIASLRRLRTELVRWQKLYPEPPTRLQAVERDVARLQKQVEATLKKMKT